MEGGGGFNSENLERMKDCQYCDVALQWVWTQSLDLAFLEHHVCSYHWAYSVFILSTYPAILVGILVSVIFGIPFSWFLGPNSKLWGGVVGVSSGCQTTEVVLGIPLLPFTEASSEARDCFSRKLGT